MTTPSNQTGRSTLLHTLVDGETMSAQRHDPYSDEALIRAFARSEAADPHDEPVDPDALWTAARGRASPDEVGALASRMAEDPELAEEWRMAARFAEAAEQEADDSLASSDEPGADAPPTTPSAAANDAGGLRWIGGLALLAAAVLLVLAWPGRGATPYVDEAGDLRGGAGSIAAVRGEGPVPAANAVLEWSEVPDAVRYELFVSTDRLAVVSEALALTDNHHTIEPAVLAEIPAGSELVWRVEAVKADGARVVSETFVATLR